MGMSDAILPRGAFLRPALPDAALHGLPGDVTRGLAEVSDADPAAILLTFLAMLGNAAGAEPHITVGGQPQPGRLFVLIVGDAATGRKGTALALVQSLFDEAEPEWSSSCLMTGAQSGEAIVSRVADDLAWLSSDRRLLIVEPEYGRLLERMAGSTLSPILRRAWDGSALAAERVRSRQSLRASNAHISMIGQITPAELIRHYPKLSAGNGLESRCLYAYVSRQQREVSPFGSVKISAGLAKRVQSAINSSRLSALEIADPLSRELCWRRNLLPSVTMQFGDDLEQNWRKIREGMPQVNRDLGAMFDRDFTHVIRLAILYALADESAVLGMEHIRAATALWTYCARSAEVIFSLPAGNAPSGVDPKRRAQVWDALYRAYPAWLSTTQLSEGVFSNNVSKARVDVTGITESLVADGRAEMRKVGTKGRPRIEYRLAGSFSSNPVPTPGGTK